jgi:hypothetical protein
MPTPLVEHFKFFGENIGERFHSFFTFVFTGNDQYICVISFKHSCGATTCGGRQSEGLCWKKIKIFRYLA